MGSLCSCERQELTSMTDAYEGGDHKLLQQSFAKLNTPR